MRSIMRRKFELFQLFRVKEFDRNNIADAYKGIN